MKYNFTVGNLTVTAPEANISVDLKDFSIEVEMSKEEVDTYTSALVNIVMTFLENEAKKYGGETLQ